MLHEERNSKPKRVYNRLRRNDPLRSKPILWTYKKCTPTKSTKKQSGKSDNIIIDYTYKEEIPRKVSYHRRKGKKIFRDIWSRAKLKEELTKGKELVGLDESSLTSMAVEKRAIDLYILRMFGIPDKFYPETVEKSKQYVPFDLTCQLGDGTTLVCPVIAPCLFKKFLECSSNSISTITTKHSSDVTIMSGEDVITTRLYNSDQEIYDSSFGNLLERGSSQLGTSIREIRSAASVNVQYKNHSSVLYNMLLVPEVDFGKTYEASVRKMMNAQQNEESLTTDGKRASSKMGSSSKKTDKSEERNKLQEYTCSLKSFQAPQKMDSEGEDFEGGDFASAKSSSRLCFMNKLKQSEISDSKQLKTESGDHFSAAVDESERKNKMDDSSCSLLTEIKHLAEMPGKSSDFWKEVVLVITLMEDVYKPGRTQEKGVTPYKKDRIQNWLTDGLGKIFAKIKRKQEDEVSNEVLNVFKDVTKRLHQLASHNASTRRAQQNILQQALAKKHHIPTLESIDKMRKYEEYLYCEIDDTSSEEQDSEFQSHRVHDYMPYGLELNPRLLDRYKTDVSLRYSFEKVSEEKNLDDKYRGVEGHLEIVAPIVELPLEEYLATTFGLSISEIQLLEKLRKKCLFPKDIKGFGRSLVLIILDSDPFYRVYIAKAAMKDEGTAFQVKEKLDTQERKCLLTKEALMKIKKMFEKETNEVRCYLITSEFVGDVQKAYDNFNDVYGPFIIDVKKVYDKDLSLNLVSVSKNVHIIPGVTGGRVYREDINEYSVLQGMPSLVRSISSNLQSVSHPLTQDSCDKGALDIISEKKSFLIENFEKIKDLVPSLRMRKRKVFDISRISVPSKVCNVMKRMIRNKPQQNRRIANSGMIRNIKTRINNKKCCAFLKIKPFKDGLIVGLEKGAGEDKYRRQFPSTSLHLPIGAEAPGALTLRPPSDWQERLQKSDVVNLVCGLPQGKDLLPVSLLLLAVRRLVPFIMAHHGQDIRANQERIMGNLGDQFDKKVASILEYRMELFYTFWNVLRDIILDRQPLPGYVTIAEAGGTDWNPLHFEMVVYEEWFKRQGLTPPQYLHKKVLVASSSSSDEEEVVVYENDEFVTKNKRDYLRSLRHWGQEKDSGMIRNIKTRTNNKKCCAFLKIKPFKDGLIVGLEKGAGEDKYRRQFPSTSLHLPIGAEAPGALTLRPPSDWQERLQKSDVVNLVCGLPQGKDLLPVSLLLLAVRRLVPFIMAHHGQDIRANQERIMGNLGDQFDKKVASILEYRMELFYTFWNVLRDIILDRQPLPGYVTIAEAGGTDWNPLHFEMVVYEEWFKRQGLTPPQYLHKKVLVASSSSSDEEEVVVYENDEFVTKNKRDYLRSLRHWGQEKDSGMIRNIKTRINNKKCCAFLKIKPFKDGLKVGLEKGAGEDKYRRQFPSTSLHLPIGAEAPGALTLRPPSDWQERLQKSDVVNLVCGLPQGKDLLPVSLLLLAVRRLVPFILAHHGQDIRANQERIMGNLGDQFDKKVASILEYRMELFYTFWNVLRDIILDRQPLPGYVTIAEAGGTDWNPLHFEMVVYEEWFKRQGLTPPQYLHKKVLVASSSSSDEEEVVVYENDEFVTKNKRDYLRSLRHWGQEKSNVIVPYSSDPKSKTDGGTADIICPYCRTRESIESLCRCNKVDINIKEAIDSLFQKPKIEETAQAGTKVYTDSLYSLIKWILEGMVFLEETVSELKKEQYTLYSDIMCDAFDICKQKWEKTPIEKCETTFSRVHYLQSCKLRTKPPNSKNLDSNMSVKSSQNDGEFECTSVSVVALAELNVKQWKNYIIEGYKKFAKLVKKVYKYYKFKSEGSLLKAISSQYKSIHHLQKKEFQERGKENFAKDGQSTCKLVIECPDEKLFGQRVKSSTRELNLDKRKTLPWNQSYLFDSQFCALSLRQRSNVILGSLKYLKVMPKDHSFPNKHVTGRSPKMVFQAFCKHHHERRQSAVTYTLKEVDKGPGLVASQKIDAGCSIYTPEYFTVNCLKLITVASEPRIKKLLKPYIRTFHYRLFSTSKRMRTICAEPYTKPMRGSWRYWRVRNYLSEVGYPEPGMGSSEYFYWDLYDDINDIIVFPTQFKLMYYSHRFVNTFPRRSITDFDGMTTAPNQLFSGLTLTFFKIKNNGLLYTTFILRPSRAYILFKPRSSLGLRWCYYRRVCCSYLDFSYIRIPIHILFTYRDPFLMWVEDNFQISNFKIFLRSTIMKFPIPEEDMNLNEKVIMYGDVSNLENHLVLDGGGLNYMESEKGSKTSEESEEGEVWSSCVKPLEKRYTAEGLKALRDFGYDVPQNESSSSDSDVNNNIYRGYSKWDRSETNRYYSDVKSRVKSWIDDSQIIYEFEGTSEEELEKIVNDQSDEDEKILSKIKATKKYHIMDKSVHQLDYKVKLYPGETIMFYDLKDVRQEKWDPPKIQQKNPKKLYDLTDNSEYPYEVGWYNTRYGFCISLEVIAEQIKGRAKFEKEKRLKNLAESEIFFKKIDETLEDESEELNVPIEHEEVKGRKKHEDDKEEMEDEEEDDEDRDSDKIPLLVDLRKSEPGIGGFPKKEKEMGEGRPEAEILEGEPEPEAEPEAAAQEPTEEEQPAAEQRPEEGACYYRERIEEIQSEPSTSEDFKKQYQYFDIDDLEGDERFLDKKELKRRVNRKAYQKLDLHHLYIRKCKFPLSVAYKNVYHKTAFRYVKDKIDIVEKTKERQNKEWQVLRRRQIPANFKRNLCNFSFPILKILEEKYEMRDWDLSKPESDYRPVCKYFGSYFSHFLPLEMFHQADSSDREGPDLLEDAYGVRNAPFLSLGLAYIPQMRQNSLLPPYHDTVRCAYSWQRVAIYHYNPSEQLFQVFSVNLLSGPYFVSRNSLFLLITPAEDVPLVPQLNAILDDLCHIPKKQKRRLYWRKLMALERPDWISMLNYERHRKYARDIRELFMKKLNFYRKLCKKWKHFVYYRLISRDQPRYRPKVDTGLSNYVISWRTFYSIYLFSRENIYDLYNIIMDLIFELSDGNSLMEMDNVRYKTVEEFKEAMDGQRTGTQSYLSGHFRNLIINSVVSFLEPFYKGHYDIYWNSTFWYHCTKTSRLLKLFKLLIEGSFKRLLARSLQNYATAFEICTENMTDVNDEFNWGDDLASTRYTSRDKPIFRLKIRLDVDLGAYFNENLDIYEDVIVGMITKSVLMLHDIAEIEPFVHKKLLFGRVNNFLGTGLKDAVVVQAVDRVSSSVRIGLIAIRAYVKQFERFLPLWKLTPDEYCLEYSQAEHSVVEIRDEIVNQMTEADNLKTMVPDSLEVGMFELNMQVVKENLIEKRNNIAQLHLDFYANKMRTLMKDALEEYRRVIHRLEQEPNSIEDLVEMREWLETLPTWVTSHSTYVHKLCWEYYLLDFFKYKVAEVDFKQKWEAKIWPKKILSEIKQVKKELTKLTAKFKKIQVENEFNLGDKIEYLTTLVTNIAKQDDINKIDEVAVDVDKVWAQMREVMEYALLLNERQLLFRMKVTPFDDLNSLIREFEPYKSLWLTSADWRNSYQTYMDNPIMNVKVDTIEFMVNDNYRMISKCARAFHDMPGCQRIALTIKEEIEKFKVYIPLMQHLRNPGMRERHWDEVYKQTGIRIVINPNITFREILETGIGEHRPEMKLISEKANKEYVIEQALEKIRSEWEDAKLSVNPYKNTGTYIMKIAEEYMQQMEDHMLVIQQLAYSPFKGPFEGMIEEWETTIKLVMSVIEEWIEVQKQWMYLEPIFTSPDVSTQLPLENKKFQIVQRSWKRIMNNAFNNPLIIEMASDVRLLDQLQKSNETLESVARGLAEYLESKRKAFPRFYFLSDDELLEILSQAKNPLAVQPHLRKCFENIYKLTFEDKLEITEMYSAEGECVRLIPPMFPKGQCETWLRKVEETMKNTVKMTIRGSLIDITLVPRAEWVLRWPGQIVIAGSQAIWTALVERAILRRRLSKCLKNMLIMLDSLRSLVKGYLSRVQRQVLCALIVIEVHARDVLANLIQGNVINSNEFDWISQLRFTFEGTYLELKPSCAVFITMNPGYAGRTELPDNLKALFRPVAMMVPDYTLIAEISLFSFGFSDARQLAGKITTTFKLSSEQLSTQDHYDFGMRAVKTVIAVAGNLKRELPTMDEKQIILRALKDVNVPKFLKDDLKLFRGIVSDLFPRMEAEAIDYGTLETSIRKTILSLNLQDVNEYVMKVIQLYETVVVRHGLMLVGPTGSGKTKCYEVLKDAMTGCKGEMSPSGLPFEAVWTYVLNPKSITMGQLYGEFDLQTHEWTDGILPSMVRLGAGATDNDKRWYVFDGPVDAVWIENMNTVLDDNKKLCLTSGEIIKMTEHMTMMFEVADLAVASPATVSRCGMVYLEPAILGIKPFINCWIKTLPELALLLGPRFEKLLYRYALNGLQYLRENLKEIVTSVDSNILQSTFRLLDHFLKPLTGPDGKAPPGADQQNLMPGLQSGWVVFATIWSVGATMDHISRDLFSVWMKKKMLKHRAFPQFPGGGSVYDYRLHDGGFADQTEDGSFRKPSWVSWLEGLPDYHIEIDVRYSDIEVPTMDNVRSAELLGLLLGDFRNVLCIGPTGTGKTLTIMSKMSRNMPKKFICDFMSFSARTTAAQTQEQIESRLERRRRNALGPPILRRQILFIDDFNMPALEVFGAQPPLELIRQYMDFGGWYDKKTVGEFKYLVDVNLIAGMGPPGGGRNPVTARLLRHFHYVAFTELSMDSKKRIFGKILQFWIDRVPHHKELYDAMLSTTLEVFTVIEKELLPTPTKTHYTFNLRDLSKVFQGILMARPENIERLEDLIKLYYHENCRVYQDRLVNDTDREWFDSMIKTKISVNFNCDADSIIGEEVLLFGDFLRLQENRNYILMEDRGEISEVLKDRLEDYNANTTAPMNLVLFLDAISHVCRITRIVRQPLGNGLLLGMAGSGRQSLTRLSAFVLEYFCFQIELSKSYGNNEWREDLKNVMIKSGVYKRETVFLFSDTQIKAESFLEDLNNILNSGDVPNIYAVEDMEIINNAMKMAVAELGLQATKSNLFSCYLKIVRANLHVCITMSPIGELFRARLRQFPALVNCCTIDWFCDWPNSALESVGYQFLEKMPDLGLSSEPILEGIVYTCMTMHQSVIESNQRFAQELSRHVYITPTSYLELLHSYSAMFKKKKDEIVQQIDRLRIGLGKLLKTSEDVVVLQQDLVETQPRLVVAQQEAQTMVEQIEKDRAIAEVTMTDIDFEKTEAEKTAQVTEKIANEAKAELEKAMPALLSAEMSLKALNKGDISEVKALKKPPGGVILVMEVLCLMKRVKPQKLPGNMPGEKIDDYWEPARGMLADPTNFLKSLLNYDKGALDERLISKLKPYINNPDFTPKKIIKVSKACTSLCAWVHALYKWYFVNKEVEPKRMALAQAKQKEEEMNKKLARSKARMEQITNRLDKLEQHLKETNDFRDELEDKALKCQQRLDRAFQLLGGLASEKTRWAETITALTLQLDNIVGDFLISAGAVAYLAPFTDDYRRSLLSHWQHIIDAKGVPHTPDCDPVTILGEPVVIRQWQLDGLPMDYLSTENAILVTNSSRWPLFIDPQRQANIWLKKTWRERSLNIVKLSDKDLMRVIEGAISFGQTVLIENVGEELDPSLDPVLAKALFLQNGVECIKLGDTVIPYHNEFRLFITTTLPNPRYSPELCIKVLLVNFALVASGLQDQLLSITVVEELPELEESRSRIVVSSAQMKAEMKSLEDKILQMISSTVGSPVDDLVLIATLDESNLKSKDIKEKVKTAAETQEKIEVIRVQFIPVAVRAQILFFCVSDLANVDPMYQYSLDWFITVFVNSIAITEKTEDIHARTKIINEHFTFSLFANICRSLFEKNKLQFAFLLCCRIMMNDNKIDMVEWNLFLAGGSPLRDILKPNVVWLTERSWMETLSLENIPKWKPFVEHFIGDFSLYKTIVDSPEPHREQLPEPWENQLDLFEKMMLIKCLRPDKVTNAMQNFISVHLEPQFIEPQGSDIEAMFKESNPLTPLIFVLSPGTDPAAELYKFAHKTKMSKRISSISLGQGQGPVAETMFIAAKDSGNWVFFQNYHLSPSWMPRLEYLVDRVSPEMVHKDFRVWLTSTPSPDFPVSILQKGSKMTIEPPRGVKANLLRAYAGQVTEYVEFLNSDNTKAQNFKWLLFSLCLFHGVCLERRKFGPLGFNIPYEFTDGDLRICISQLHMFLLEYDEIPFKVLTYTAGQINYGGRVTDDWDRRCIMNILNDYYAPEVVAPNYYFDEQMCYYQLVEKTPIADYIIYIKQLPVNDNPAIFGLHGNADITCAQAETYSSLSVLLSLQPKQVGTEGTNQDDVTKHLAEAMLTQVPAPFSNIPQLQERYPVLYNESLNTVLLQEVIRFNKLLLIIHSSLKDLLKALAGFVVMSEALETMATSLFTNTVPQLWASKAYPSLKPLGTWVTDLQQRIQFIERWIADGIPKRFWISGFYFPQAFLTGCLQNFARKYIISIDSINYKFEILSGIPEERPPDGCIIYGLFLEGARWDPNLQQLADNLPKELYTEMPSIYLIPEEFHRQPAHTYMCPIYKTLLRAGVLSTTGHSTNFILAVEVPTANPESHWIKRGVALFCALNY